VPTLSNVDINTSRNFKIIENQSTNEKIKFERKIIVGHCLVDSIVDELKLTLANTIRKYNSLKDLLMDCKKLKFLYPLIPKSILFESVDKLHEYLCSVN
jgi:hypothetical protein